MNVAAAVEALSALAQETRLAIFRLLVEAGAGGMNAGAIAEALALAAPTLSFHIAQLVRAGLVLPRQEGRFIYYSANFATMDDLIAYLTENCCQGGRHCLPTLATAVPTRRRAKASP
ncbi:MAG: ArsR/SmtB family transcription factor [Rhodocyclaceae bacterium]